MSLQGVVLGGWLFAVAFGVVGGGFLLIAFGGRSFCSG